jgi:hypothetical protein
VLTNFYSVPAPVGTEVQVKVHAAYVEIWHKGKSIACHDRCFGRQQKVLKLEHFLDALSKKPGVFAGSTALDQCRAQGRWPVSFDQFWEASKKRRGKQDGTRAMIDLLIVGRDRGYDALRQAIEKTLEIGSSDVSVVLLLLNADRAGRQRPAEPVEIGELIRYDRPMPTTDHYDQLLKTWPDEGVTQ